VNEEAHYPDRRHRYLPNLYALKTRNLVAAFKSELGDDPMLQRIMVTRVLDYFRQQPFYYTRTPPLTKLDPVDQFVFDTRQGYCEHYASAFVVMMRAAGIPARVVTGYLGAEYNPLGGYYVVRESMAHAWAEVWMGDDGWVRVDPTAVIPTGRNLTLNGNGEAWIDLVLGSAADSAFVANVGYGLDLVNQTWNHWRANLALSSPLLILGWFHSNAKAILDLCVTILVICVAVLAHQRLRRAWINRQDSATYWYQRFCKKLEQFGLARHPYESASAYAARVIQTNPDWRKPVLEVTRLYNEMRYGKSRSTYKAANLKAAVCRFRPRSF
jgi:hypothetical protein